MMQIVSDKNTDDIYIADEFQFGELGKNCGTIGFIPSLKFMELSNSRLLAMKTSSS